MNESSSAMTRGASVTLTASRRNGKLPSCEPCRKAKIACDHLTPVCGRCLKRGDTAACVYHPAPMTRARTTDAITTSPLASRGSSHGASTNTHRPEPARTDREENASPQDQYYGNTSIAAALKDVLAQGRPALVAPVDLLEPSRTSSENVGAGVRMLRQADDLHVFSRLVERWFRLRQGLVIMPSIVRQLATSLNHKLEQLLGPSPDDEMFTSASQTIFQNARHPLFTHQQVTVASFAGVSCRWETLGIVFVLAGLSANSLFEGDPLLVKSDGTIMQRAKFVDDMVAASDCCVVLSMSAGPLNDLKLQLLYMSYVLLTVHCGDLDHRAWARLGDLSSAVYTLGLHIEPAAVQNVSLLLSELRKRTFAAIYCADKDAATITGRPPRISRKYCMRQMPLDLSDEDLSTASPDITRLSDQLDGNGWNTGARICRATWIRVKMLLSVVREDILELSLGPILDDTLTRAHELDLQLEGAWSDIPYHCRHDQNGQNPSQPAREISEQLTVLLVYLDYLLSKLILRKVIDKATFQQFSGESFEAAHRLLSEVLMLAAERERYAEFRTDFMWALSAHGLPAAAVVSSALVWHMQTDNPTQDFPRSDVVQLLSVFATCMKWVAKTEHANTAVHSQASVAVRAVLDTILSTQQSLPISSQAEPHGSVAAWNMFSPSNLSAFNDPTLEQILNTDLDNDFMDVEAGSVQ